MTAREVWWRLLGHLPDHAIAERFGVHHTHVRLTRVALEIPPCARWRSTVAREECLLVLFTVSPDREFSTPKIANHLGVDNLRARRLLRKMERDGLVVGRRRTATAVVKWKLRRFASRRLIDLCEAYYRENIEAMQLQVALDIEWNCLYGSEPRPDDWRPPDWPADPPPRPTDSKPGV